MASVSFSGSTLLAFVLNVHPDVATVGEVGLIPKAEMDRDYQCSCGHRFVECPFFRQIQSRMRDKGFAFVLDNMAMRFRYSNSRVVQKLIIGDLFSSNITQVRNKLRGYMPGFENWLESKRQRNKAFGLSVLEITSKHWFLDATKDWFRLDLLRKTDGINLKVIRLIRDPRGFCNSARKHQQVSVRKAANAWVRGNRHIGAVLDNIPPEHIYQLNYEAFCQFPHDALRSITEFLGISPMSPPEDYRSVPHHIVGNRMRLPSDGRTEIRLDERWRRELGEEDKSAIMNITGRLAERYGYLRD
ncbi:MAG: sulfotransferase [Planctomycetota bacterium]|jgi:hypothetical protein